MPKQQPKKGTYTRRKSTRASKDKWPEAGSRVQVISRLVDKRLANAWKVEGSQLRCLAFDAILPVRMFAEGEAYDSDKDFADPPPASVRTVYDNPLAPLNPIKPDTYELPYRFGLQINPYDFLCWTEGEVREITIIQEAEGTRAEREYRRSIPIPYDHVVSQLMAEVQHGRCVESHESLRRETYAAQTLALFAKEIIGSTCEPREFRSKILTPILQRQCWGVYDAYLPGIRIAVCDAGSVEERTSRSPKQPGNNREPTNAEITTFYLGDDPTDPALIRTYRRNLLFLPDARWHLGITMQKGEIGDDDYRRLFWKDQDLIMAAYKSQPVCTPQEGSESPFLFTKVDLEAIEREGLNDYFVSEFVDLVDAESEDLLSIQQLEDACQRIVEDSTADRAQVGHGAG